MRPIPNWVAGPVHARRWQRPDQSCIRTGAGGRRSAGGDRHRNARIARVGAEHQAAVRHLRRFDHRAGHRRISRQVGRRSVAARARHHGLAPAVERRQQSLLGGARHGIDSRPHVREDAVQRPRQLLRRRLSRSQLQRRVAGAHGGRRLLQESDRGDDRRRHRGHRQPAHAHAVRRADRRRSR